MAFRFCHILPGRGWGAIGLRPAISEHCQNAKHPTTPHESVLPAKALEPYELGLEYFSNFTEGLRILLEGMKLNMYNSTWTVLPAMLNEVKYHANEPVHGGFFIVQVKINILKYSWIWSKIESQLLRTFELSSCTCDAYRYRRWTAVIFCWIGA